MQSDDVFVALAVNVGGEFVGTVNVEYAHGVG